MEIKLITKILLQSFVLKISSFTSHPFRIHKQSALCEERHQYPSRRDFFFTSIPIFSIPALTFLIYPFFSPNPSDAACLLGDTSPDCIGYYKVPLDDAIDSYIETPEKLAEYAPGIRWVPPTSYPNSYVEATSEIQNLAIRIKALEMTVLKGNLTAAGVELLAILPRISVCGKFVMSTLQTMDDRTQELMKQSKLQAETEIKDYGLRSLRVEASFVELLSNLNAVDILLGQTIRGELGSITAGQIQIISELRIANHAMEDMLLAIPQTLIP
jgi:hypothetical protein